MLTSTYGDRHRNGPRAVARRGALLLLLALAAQLHGCASTAPRPGAEVHAEGFETLLDAGMAVAAVLALDPVVLHVDHTPLMTDELFATLFVSGGRAPLVAPDEVEAIVANGGSGHVEKFRAFRRDLAGGESPTQERCVRLSRVVQHRFLFASWYSESTSGGVETGTGDYREQGFANEVGRTEYSEVVGSIEAGVVDLWEGRIVWRAQEDYRTARLYGEVAAIEAELERTRVGAAARLAGRFGPT